MSNISDFSKKIKKQDFSKNRNQARPQKQHFSAKMNKNNTFYEEKPDFDLLAIKYDYLEPFTFINENGITTIDWNNPKACIALNKALLEEYYGISYWTIPEGYLCPTITSRVNYLNWINDLLTGVGIKRTVIKGLDIGTGSSLIYPILGLKIYKWNFLGTGSYFVLKFEENNTWFFVDINEDALKNAEEIRENNGFTDKIELRKSEDAIFKGVIKSDEKFTFTMCNPPYFSSRDEKIANPARECIAQDAELVTEGGEEQFIAQMMEESFEFKDQVSLFTTLIGRKKNVDILKNKLEELQIKHKIKTKVYDTTFYQGKTLRWGLAWHF